jgi:hypothetical protein
MERSPTVVSAASAGRSKPSDAGCSAIGPLLLMNHYRRKWNCRTGAAFASFICRDTRSVTADFTVSALICFLVETCSPATISSPICRPDFLTVVLNISMPALTG